MTTATLEAPPGIAPGWYPGQTMRDYLAIDAMSASMLEEFRRSPLHYRYRRENPLPPSDALERGTALHLALLEPHLFHGAYVVAEPCAQPLKSGVRKGEPCGNAGLFLHTDCGWLCGVHAKGFGSGFDTSVEILSAEIHEAVIGMRDAVLAHPRARSLLEGEGELEVTGVFEDEASGVLCKIRPDRLVRRASMSVNVKSTRDASPHAFGADAARRGYHRREAFYRRGMQALGMDCTASAIIAVEASAPYAVAVYLYNEDHLRVAGEDVSRLLSHFAFCRDTDHWPPYNEEFQELRLPAWAVNGEVDDV